MVTEKMIEALKPCPFCGGKPNDEIENNGLGSYWIVCDNTRDACGCEGPYQQSEEDAATAWNRRGTSPPLPSVDALPDVGQWSDDDRARAWREAFETMHQRAMKAEAALSTDAEPVAWYWEDATGCFHITLDRSDVVEMAKTVGCTPKPLFAGLCDTSRFFEQPAPSVAVKALQWDEDGDKLKARMGDREWMLNITADGKTWAGSTRPFVFGRNLTWSSVPNCSMVSLEAAKAACQTDCQSRYASLFVVKTLDADDVINELAALPCETEGVEDLEAGCCRTCRARSIRSALSAQVQDVP